MKESGGSSFRRVSCYTNEMKYLRLLAVAALAVAPSAPDLAQPATPSLLVAAVALPGAPDGAQAYRIVYRSTDGDGMAIDVTGVVIVPLGTAPKGGRNIVAWAHGTSGIADACAPSTNSWLFDSIAGLHDLLKHGYIVAATDYQGLGGPGPHPYLIGKSAAHSVLDAVRAARAVPNASASNRFVLWGESQGGHATLWSAQLAATYAPELELVGAAADAPPVDLVANLTGNTNAAVRALTTAYAGASWSEIYGIPLSTITGPLGEDLIHRLAKNCVTLDGFKLRTKIGLMRLTRQFRGLDLNASPRWSELMKVNSVDPRALGVPLLIAQGSADVIVAPQVTRHFVEQICRDGQPLRFIEVAGGDHVTIAKRTATTTIDWIGDRFAGRPVPDDCSRL
jgi:dipeptidyl aminopeptidase/acylaminoacyl peptidase